MKKIYLVLMCMIASLMACEKDIDFAETVLTISTIKSTATSNSVELACVITTDATVSDVCVQYTTDRTFSTYEQAEMAEYTTGCYQVKIVGLEENTVYCYRYMVSNSISTLMSKAVEQFRTLERTTVDENGYAYVDLGLSVKWATCNVGASKPEEYGDYFAWGETKPKDYYDWSTYKYCNGSSSSFTKYNNSSSYGTVDNKTQLELSDDAARANWGGSWRIPTQAEQDELREQCTWTWTTQNGVKGYKVTSKKSGYTNKSIFLPAAGYRDDSSLDDAGSYGGYWSSSLCTGSPNYAWDVDFYSSNVGRDGNRRDCGFSVRPVYGESAVSVSEPTVTTAAATQVTETTAVTGGNVTSDGGATVTERGVVYSTVSNPVINNINHTTKTSGSGTGSFSVNLTNLVEGRTYYVRAYAINSKGTAYGEQVSFTTKTSSTGNENGYAYVDLGLSVKWATCNVGASKPEEYGDYFAWGETKPKDYYDWSTYKYCNGSYNTLTKYNNSSNYGTVDNKTQLELSDDAARANWGGSWRMPTQAEQNELRENCTWTWTTQNGVYGYKVASKKSGYTNKFIFLPAAGDRYDSSLYHAGSCGYYWSSSLYADYPGYARLEVFNSSNVYRYYNNRGCGFSVRPVCQ